MIVLGLGHQFFRGYSLLQGTETPRADHHPSRPSRQKHGRAVEVEVPAAEGAVFGMADIVSELGTPPAKLTSSGHLFLL